MPTATPSSALEHLGQPSQPVAKSDAQPEVKSADDQPQCTGDSCVVPKRKKKPLFIPPPPEPTSTDKNDENVPDKAELVEDVLREPINKWILFPIRYDGLWKLYKQALGSFWVVEEVDLSQDMRDWDGLTADERGFIKHVLAFFAGADLIVLNNLNERFMNDVKIPEAKAFYTAQLQQEIIHSEMYSLLLQTYVPDKAEMDKLFNAIQTMDAVKAKADWAIKWMGSDRPFAERLIAFAAVELIMFSGSFCAIFWLKKRNKMPGLAFSNEKISQDEGLHCQFAIQLFHLLKNKPSQTVVHEIVRSALDAERLFVSKSLPVNLIGMNSSLMIQYVEYVGDFLLDALGYEKHTKSENPFDWMTLISLQGKTSFFERRVGEYQKADALSRISSTNTSNANDPPKHFVSDLDF